ncbi:MAG: hypothetical protein PHV30_03815 [Candidatus Margulisbacteria bacterium]|nr:hypothetical protein [Candidatus Margulisiibacteriota bacterium]
MRTKIIADNNNKINSSVFDNAFLQRSNQVAMDIITSIFLKNTLPSFFPSELQLDLTGYCSYKKQVQNFKQHKTGKQPPKDCLNCSYKQADLHTHLPITKNLSIINSFAHFGGRQLFLTGGGEPGEYKEFPQIFKMALKQGLLTEFNSWGAAFMRINKIRPNQLKALYKNYQNTIQWFNVSIHELNNEHIFQVVQETRKIIEKYNLPLKIRTSMLLHPDTNKAEINNFLKKSKKYGAAMASFKPAYSFDEQQKTRKFFKNEALYSIIKDKEASSTPQFIINSNRLDRLLYDYRMNFPVCFAPLLKMHINSLGQAAMCCDTKDISQGNIKPFILSSTFPENPGEYFLKAQKGMLCFTDWRKCVQGCNMFEANNYYHNMLQGSEVYQRFLRKIK